MRLIRDLISGKNRPGIRGQIKSITIHETANSNPGANARMHRDYAQNTDRDVSYHWTVDDKEAIQMIPDNEVAWHTGTKEGNETSIGIEVCENKDADPVARYDNAVWLAAYLLHKHRLSINELVPHYKWYGKNCPRNILPYWDEFKQDVASMLSSIRRQKTHILGKSEVSQDQMRAYLKKVNPDAPDYVTLYLEMEEKEGVRADVAFAQSLLETGAWKFGGVVKEEWNNFAGLGATGSDHPGLRFTKPIDGIMAQGRHLRLYAEYRPELNDKKVDPRGLPEHLMGWAPFVEDLSGKWAADIMYGIKIRNILQKMKGEETGDIPPVLHPPADWKAAEIKKLKDRGLILSDHHPDETVTFAALATIINRLIDKK